VAGEYKTRKISENSHVSTESNSWISSLSTGYQPDIKAFSTPDIKSCHRLVFTVTVGYKQMQAIRLLPYND